MSLHLKQTRNDSSQQKHKNRSFQFIAWVLATAIHCGTVGIQIVSVHFNESWKIAEADVAPAEFNGALVEEELNFEALGVVRAAKNIVDENLFRILKTQLTRI